MTPYKIEKLGEGGVGITIDLEHVVAVGDAAPIGNGWSIGFSVFFMFRDQPVTFTVESVPYMSEEMCRELQQSIVEPLIAAWEKINARV